MLFLVAKLVRELSYFKTTRAQFQYIYHDRSEPGRLCNLACNEYSLDSKAGLRP